MDFKDYVKSVNGQYDQLGDFSSYRVIKLIGKGGQANVYEVEKKGTKYAMKVPNLINLTDTSESINIPRDDDLNNDFMKEAQNWAELSTIVPDAVVDFVDYNIDPFPWMVMEYADRDFKSAMEDNSVDLSDFIDLLDSLSDIHDQGIIHLDIKPENILEIDGEGWKFSDFGMSKVIGRSTASVNVKGTIEYMAPEQTTRKKIKNQTTDIWQMGILLYHMVTGHSPYVAKDFNGILMEIITDGPDLKDVPEYLLPVLSKALAAEQQDRYQFADDFKSDLLIRLDLNATDKILTNLGSEVDPDDDYGPTEEEIDLILDEAMGNVDVDRLSDLGYGVQITPDGVFYGQLRDNKRNGVGVAFSYGGGKSIGMWKDDAPFGGNINFYSADSTDKVTIRYYLGGVCLTNNVFIKDNIIQYMDGSGNAIICSSISQIPDVRLRRITEFYLSSLHYTKGEDSSLDSDINSAYRLMTEFGEDNRTFGKQTYDNGEWYEGEFLDGLRCGFGVYHWNTGAAYIGYWRDNDYDGYGAFYDERGFKSDCFFYDGKNIGTKLLGENGIERNVLKLHTINDEKFSDVKYDQDSYTGEIVDDLRSGLGIYRWEDGSTYVGNWVEGQPGGYGRYYYPSESSETSFKPVAIGDDLDDREYYDHEEL